MDYSKKINKAVDYINNNLDKPILVDDLAQIAGLSTFHFHRIFSEYFEETVAKHIARKRMEKAARELIRNNDTPIAEIAYNVGYTSAPVFCRNFKVHFGCTATKYRSNKGEQNSKNSQNDSTYKNSISTLTQYLCCCKTIKIGDKIMNCNFEIKELQPKNVIYYRHIGAYSNMGVSIGKLMQWAYPRGLAKPPILIGATYLDDPNITPVDKLQTDVFLVVDHDVKVEGAIGKYTIGGGMYAVGRYEIAINEYAQAWGSMCKLIADHGCRSIDGCYHELYLNNPDEHPEKKHIIDICIPVEPA